MHPAPDAQPTSGDVKPARKTVTQQLADAEKEIQRLQATNDALLNQSLNAWLTVVGDEARALAQVYSTLSWRITRPLRVVRQVQLKVSEVGPSETSALVAARLKQRLGRRA